MSYQVLARRYRPGTFDEVVGQDHITSLLEKAVAAGRIAQAYLFCGPRGIGKTSCARILAKCLNCEQGPTTRPCGSCTACREIAQGGSFDVLEIDGASNRGIDEIRTIRENVKFAPGFGRYKIYIVDEVHMLTAEAFNALLKTLEEPPEHVKFIFATTDPNKLPPTILSRCQRFDFKRMGLKTLAGALAEVARKEGMTVTREALYAIAKAAQGSFRDALGILDQLGALSDREIGEADVASMLGLVELDRLFALADALAEGDCPAALKIFDEILEIGKDVRQLNRDLLEHFRHLMIMKIGGKTLGRLVAYPVEIKERYLAQSRRFTLERILTALDLFIEAQETARVTETFVLPMEIAFARMTMDAAGGAPEVRPASEAERISSAPPSRGERRPPARPSGGEGSVSGPGPQGAMRESGRDAAVAAVIDDEDPVEEIVEEPVGGSAVPAPLDLDKVKRAWKGLTYAVSRERMSLATFLQEGHPVGVEGGAIVVAFASEHRFHMESLEDDEALRVVERVFAEKLRTKVRLIYRLLDEEGRLPAVEEDDPVVKAALATLEGRIVEKWHRD